MVVARCHLCHFSQIAGASLSRGSIKESNTETDHKFCNGLTQSITHLTNLRAECPCLTCLTCAAQVLKAREPHPSQFFQLLPNTTSTAALPTAIVSAKGTSAAPPVAYPINSTTPTSLPDGSGGSEDRRQIEGLDIFGMCTIFILANFYVLHSMIHGRVSTMSCISSVLIKALASHLQRCLGSLCRSLAASVIGN